LHSGHTSEEEEDEEGVGARGEGIEAGDSDVLRETNNLRRLYFDSSRTMYKCAESYVLTITHFFQRRKKDLQQKITVLASQRGIAIFT
jgi:hypothetical protein